MERLNTHRIAVLIPCYNEEKTVAKVIEDFKLHLPQAVIYVCDNASTDNTCAKALAAGAIVIKEPHKGKGNAVMRMFADIDADVYVMADGDCTYLAKDAPCMIEELISNNLDMVNGRRISKNKSTYPFGHKFGNWMFGKIVSVIFKSKNIDMLSGYKILSRRFVKSFPWHCHGFDLESKITVYAMAMELPMTEKEINYLSRPKNSHSKLNTYRDGAHVLSAIFFMVKEERAFTFFSIIALILGIIGIILGIPLVWEYQETGLVSRIPTAIIIVGLFTCSTLSFITGLILHTVTNGHKEHRREVYLAQKAPKDL